MPVCIWYTCICPYHSSVWFLAHAVLQRAGECFSVMSVEHDMQRRCFEAGCSSAVALSLHAGVMAETAGIKTSDLQATHVSDYTVHWLGHISAEGVNHCGPVTHCLYGSILVGHVLLQCQSPMHDCLGITYAFTLVSNM
jgi:hypothetical protein